MRSEGQARPGNNGADDENRTRTTSLEDWGSTIELHPRTATKSSTSCACHRICWLRSPVTLFYQPEEPPLRERPTWVKVVAIVLVVGLVVATGGAFIQTILAAL